MHLPCFVPPMFEHISHCSETELHLVCLAGATVVPQEGHSAGRAVAGGPRRDPVQGLLLIANREWCHRSPTKRPRRAGALIRLPYYCYHCLSNNSRLSTPPLDKVAGVSTGLGAGKAAAIASWVNHQHSKCKQTPCCMEQLRSSFLPRQFLDAGTRPSLFNPCMAASSW